ncbi:hypothetical protein [Arhodomonas sp. SL1]|uniref:hypothetical protein n=1 Tax=Arhodomonas sp. SL1 TaxID=3425691 RepID=UPI003F882B5D
MPQTDLETQRAGQRRLVSALARRPSPLEQPVEITETHLSWVLLTPSWVFKLKKALRYDYLDYGSLEARQHQCEEEVRLNRRLAPQCYRGVRAVTGTLEAGLELDGNARALDYLVHMRRLPRQANLEQRLRAGRVDNADIDALARVLSDFYQGLPGEPLAPQAYIADLRADVDRDAEHLLTGDYALERGHLRGLRRDLLGLIDDQASILSQRVRQGFVVEGHGDLRPEHVYLLPRPVAIDCLEFNRRMRLLDVADELGFLAMECARLGAAWAGERLRRCYADRSGDEAPEVLYRLFMARRALLWAKLAVWHLDRDPAADRDKWTGRARGYVELAGGYLA